MAELKPRAPIRRFDVFAEYNRLQAIEDGIPPDEAAGYGLWVAKVVAARVYGHALFKQKPSQVRERAAAREGAPEGQARPKWHTLDGKPQTDELFDHEIVARMGRDFYTTVFSPAIAEALDAGKSYQAIRDSIRRDWTPGPPG